MRTERLARLHLSTDAQMGERVRIRPKTAGGYTAASDDPYRPPVEFVAHVALIPQAVRTAGNLANSGHNAEFRSSADTIKFASDALPYDAQAGDAVDLVDRDGTPAYQISRLSPFGTGRIVAFLIREAAS